MTQNPQLFWGLIVSMWIGNVMLLVLNLPLIGVWVRLLSVPYRVLFPAIMAFMAIGVYSLNNQPLEIYLTLLLGVLGYLFIQLKCEPAPLLVAFVLGPLMEENLRRALSISRGNPVVFVTQPISAGFLAATAILVVAIVVPLLRRKGRRAGL
jgi:TctA family transporter